MTHGPSAHTRPLKASDCTDGKVFTCKEATSAADGRPLTQPVELSCSCVEPSVNLCEGECQRAFGQGEQYEEYMACIGNPVEPSALCGCAIALLK